MDKQIIVSLILAHLDQELASYAKAALVSQEDATDEQNRAENKYDTRGLEASYLAAGQSLRGLETQWAKAEYASLPLRAYAADETISVGALIRLGTAGEESWYFFGPAAGGTEVICEGQEILVITVKSPLGSLLQGKRAGEEFATGNGATAMRHKIRAVL